MRYLKLPLIALVSALCATYIVLWLTKPAPLENTTIPPLMIKEEQNELLVWHHRGIPKTRNKCSRNSLQPHIQYLS